MRLGTEPGATTTVAISGHSGTDVSVDKDTLTFTRGNWNTPQTVKVTAGPDHDADDEAVTLAHSASGGEYEDVSAALAVTVIDDDSAMLVLSTTTLEVMEGDETGVTYTVRLATQPSQEVTVAVSGHTDTDVSVDKATLTFTTENWNTPQSVTVMAGDDADTSDEAVTLTHSASGGEYAGVSAALAVTVIGRRHPGAGPEHDDDRGGGGGRDRRDLHGEAGYRARRNDDGGDIRLCGYGRGPVHDVPGVHHIQLEHPAGGEGDRRGRRGHLRRGGDARSQRVRSRVRLGYGRAGGHGDRRRHSGAGAEHDDDRGDGGRRDRRDLHGEAGDAAQRGSHRDGLRPLRHRRVRGQGHTDVH